MATHAAEGIPFRMNGPSPWHSQTLSADRALHQDASLIFARAGPPAVRFMHDWISAHKHDIPRLGNSTRHDQAN